MSVCRPPGVEELLDRPLPLTDPSVLLRVAELASDPAGDVRAIAREASRDEALAALILRLANSATQGRGFRVSDLPTAITRLGLRLVGTLAITAPALRLLEACPRDDLTPARRSLHEHAVKTGITARLLALPDVEPEAALAAGLLHNLGLTLVSLHDVDAFRRLVELAGSGQRLALHEPQLLGVTHAELGAALAERWSYPPLLVDAIREHDLVEPTSRMAQVVRAADLLTRMSGHGVEAVEPMAAELLAPAADPAATAGDWMLAATPLRSRDLADCLLDVA
jgi:HD-like signal output (HDOD) protein